MPDRENIIAMARQAGWPDSLVVPIFMDNLVEFAALVAAQEREQCAKVIEQTGPSEGHLKLVTEGFALAIRARKEET